MSNFISLTRKSFNNDRQKIKYLKPTLIIKTLFVLIILFGCNSVEAQEIKFDVKIAVQQDFKREIEIVQPNLVENEIISMESVADEEFRKIRKSRFFTSESKIERKDFVLLEIKGDQEIEDFDLTETVLEEDFKEINFSNKQIETPENKDAERFHWKSAFIQSGIFLGIQHGFRLMQKRTTRELGGPFFADWKNSVKNLRGWEDDDILFINYVAHPMQGAATGRIFINNSDKSKKLEFGSSKDYWTSRLKAMAWSAAWSTQFEIGPISEATIGNVGIHDNYGRSRMAWVDMVITPTAGTGVLIGEDIIDKYILKIGLREN